MSAILNVSVSVCECVTDHHMENSTRLDVQAITAFATGMGLAEQSIHSLFATHLLSPGDAQEEERGKK